MEKTKVILKYLDGRMDPEESEQFEDLIRKNKELERELRLFQDVNEVILAEDVSQFRSLLREIVHQDPVSRKPKRKSFKRFLMIPAAAMLLILIGTGIWYLGQEESAADLYAEYYSPYQSFFVTRSPGLSAGQFEQARQLYKKHRYQEAAFLLQSYTALYPDHTEAHFYLALCSLALKAPERAIAELNPIVEGTNSPFTLHARWYLALAHLKTGDIEKARYFLSRLSHEDTMYTMPAKKLNRRLKNIHKI